MLIVPPSAFRTGTSLINVLSNLGLTSGLKLCLDAGDKNSYDGSSQTWKDLSGNGTDFYRGSGSGSDSADPTFNGTAGRLSSGEYFSNNASQLFSLASGSNPSAFDAMHKDNQSWAVAIWFYSVAGGGWFYFSTNPTSVQTNKGVSLFNSGSSPGRTTFQIYNGTSGQGVNAFVTNALPDAAWNFLGLSVTVSSGSVTINKYIPSTSESADGTAVSHTGSPSSSAASSSMQLFGSGPPSGSRLASMSLWSTSLTAAQLASVYTATKARFGL